MLRIAVQGERSSSNIIRGKCVSWEFCLNRETPHEVTYRRNRESWWTSPSNGSLCNERRSMEHLWHEPYGGGTVSGDEDTVERIRDILKESIVANIA